MSNFLPAFVMIVALLAIGLMILACAVDIIPMGAAIVYAAAFAVIGYTASREIDQ